MSLHSLIEHSLVELNPKVEKKSKNKGKINKSLNSNQIRGETIVFMKNKRRRYNIKWLIAFLLFGICISITSAADPPTIQIVTSPGTPYLMGSGIFYPQCNTTFLNPGENTLKNISLHIWIEYSFWSSSPPFGSMAASNDISKDLPFNSSRWNYDYDTVGIGDELNSSWWCVAYAADDSILTRTANQTVVYDEYAPRFKNSFMQSNITTDSTTLNISINYNASDYFLQSCWFNSTENATITQFPCNTTTSYVFDTYSPSDTITIWYFANDTLNHVARNQTTFIISPVPSVPTGSSPYYASEQNKNSKNEILEFRVYIRKNTQEELEPSNQKGTGVSKISLNAKEHVSGTIKISKLDSLPEDCISQDYLKDKEVYKILQINSTIDNEDLENVSLSIEINNSWVNQNEIVEINAIKCEPYTDSIGTSLVQAREGYSTYDFASKGFSTWLILGSKEPEIQEIAEKEEINLETINETGDVESSIIKQEDDSSSIGVYWWLIIGGLLGAIVYFCIKIYLSKHK